MISFHLLSAVPAPDLHAVGGRGSSLPYGRSVLRLLFILLIVLLLPADLQAKAKSPKKSPERKATATQREVSQKQGNLRELRGQIQTLRKEMANTEDKHASAINQLKGVEKEISATERDLNALSQQRGKLQTTLKALDRQAKDLEHRLSTQQAQLEQLVYHQYLLGNPGTLQTMLNGGDLNQSMRDLYYLSMVGHARHEMVRDIEATLEHKHAVAETTRERASDLAEVENQHRQQHDKLLLQREQRKTVRDQMATKIAEQRRKIGDLERDEKQLSQLVERLNRILAAQEAARLEAARKEAARKEAARKEAARQQAQARKVPRRADSTQTAPPPPEIHNEQTPTTSPAGNIVQMRGRLRLPVRGAVTNRFGSARPEGGTWKGLFIRAATGSEVKAIAGGQVVFADWMRGFGNLLIVDHGAGYLSIYGNNDALLKRVGEKLNGGDVIASAGNSGGNPESGLYFEIRHQGKPIDPLKWVNL